jgi:hypothetical protein
MSTHNGAMYMHTFRTPCAPYSFWPPAATPDPSEYPVHATLWQEFLDRFPKPANDPADETYGLTGPERAAAWACSYTPACLTQTLRMLATSGMSIAGYLCLGSSLDDCDDQAQDLVLKIGGIRHAIEFLWPAIRGRVPSAGDMAMAWIMCGVFFEYRFFLLHPPSQALADALATPDEGHRMDLFLSYYTRPVVLTRGIAFVYEARRIYLDWPGIQALECMRLQLSPHRVVNGARLPIDSMMSKENYEYLPPGWATICEATRWQHEQYLANQAEALEAARPQRAA